MHLLLLKLRAEGFRLRRGEMSEEDDRESALDSTCPPAKQVHKEELEDDEEERLDNDCRDQGRIPPSLTPSPSSPLPGFWPQPSLFMELMQQSPCRLASGRAQHSPIWGHSPFSTTHPPCSSQAVSTPAWALDIATAIAGSPLQEGAEPLGGAKGHALARCLSIWADYCVVRVWILTDQRCLA